MANLPYKTPPSHRLTVSSLLSPPEMKRSESFGSSIAPGFGQSPFSSFNSVPFKSAMSTDTMSCKAAAAHRDAYASPPISPYDTQSQKENMELAEAQGARDPQLFVSGDAAVPLVDVPLFPRESVESASQDAITEHMNSQDYARLESKPTREDYELAVSFRSNVFALATKSPRRWWAQERRFDDYYGRPSGVPKRTVLKKLAPAPSSRPRQPKVALARLPPRTPRAPKVKRTPLAQMYDSFETTPKSASPKPARPATNRDDSDYNALPDYSPPLATLPKGNNKILKAEWKGQALSLTDDPDRHLLHEAELNLAGTLRLSCATYLTSKRRIFQARIEALKIGKEFRKTDAQQACKIDVNKASKLWQSYDRVGWFNPDYFRQYL
ncbi:SWIRM domain-containing protein FUN19 [Decorospora gaudefroyi]|uniref:SWIRM domain-containing protein FUN19 n=1 Tax=Decorospora gaudefroyi TaxID=184978 RepID=A0A6A5KMC1_9PLEO|nr:SWIRM domain-containing protein FUN19 [Decorospora gaudefroyi]